MEPEIYARGIGLQYLPPPDQLDVEIEPKGIWIICENSYEETSELLKIMDKKKQQVVVISLSSQPRHSFNVPQYFVEVFNESTVRDHVMMITTQHGPIVGFIGLAGNTTCSDIVQSLENEVEKRFVDFVFLMATQLKPSLTNSSATRTWFAITNTLEGIIRGGLSGLTKTLQREWPQVFCRSIDFCFELSAAEKSQLLIQELFDADQSIAEVRYQQNKRYTMAPMESLKC